ncbi:DMT family transporter [Arcobacter porcinus]|uniref:EamA/RhaT family transporter n=1 Tax=Arcobacter porcinus TaxID=1935204 RepID=A0A1C0AUR0_9BACT|nr:DMT family transporter [Arcobacter porcinus]OCL96618.1 putative inner membrane transporter YicL [Aliarcobacter thereius]OCL83658.1 putative inner membrane transporter YicL [Arcobacter porcinus]OCL83877.1 putative inner membrane transporter YicL [Arcobacter porcinus]OCL89970.1 putative inner membrane transporter YicL [Arcobacter porcinus]QEP41132.1 EamA/RhaT family transporter [Arcobacter porcinus]
MSLQTKGIILAVVSAVFYGTNPLGALILFQEGLNVTSVVFYRFLFAVILLALFMKFFKKSFYVTFQQLSILAFLGTLFGISAICLFSSFLYMDAGLASTILFVYPIFVAILMAIFFKEKSSIVVVLSIILSFAGVSLLFDSNSANISFFGLSLVLISSLCYAIYIVVINRYLKISSLKTTLYSMFFCTLTILIYSFSQENLNIMPLNNFNMWFYSIFLALIPTIFSLIFLVKAIELIGSTSASILGALEPLTAVFIGVFVFGESLTLKIVLAIFTILLSVILIVIKSYLERLLRLNKRV